MNTRDTARRIDTELRTLAELELSLAEQRVTLQRVTRTMRMGTKPSDATLAAYRQRLTALARTYQTGLDVATDALALAMEA